MIRNLCLSATIALLFGFTGCAAQQTAHEMEAHPHAYPFTEVMGDYHVRLVVNHEDGEIFLLFEDMKERPVEVMKLERIDARAELPDGTVKDVIFHPTEPVGHKYIHRYHRHLTHRMVCCYMDREGWLRTADAFQLNAEIIHEGRLYDLTFDYEKKDRS